MKRRKLWVGLSSTILMAPAVVSANPQLQPGILMAQSHGGQLHADPAKKAPADAKPTSSGEGGEGGEGGGAAHLPANLRLARGIGLIRGHLLVGHELVEAGRWADALPHFLHPTEEVYGQIRSDLKDYNVAPFEVALKALAQTVKAKNKQAYNSARAPLEERLEAATRSLTAKEASPASFTLETALELMKSAASEYEEAMKDGKIANVIEYQDGRGFVFEASRLLASVSGELAKKNGAATTAVTDALADLKKAWPSVQPPEAPAKDLGAVLSDISRVELQLGNLH